MVTKRNTGGPPGQVPATTSMVNDIHQGHRRIFDRLDKMEAETTALITNSFPTSSRKHETLNAEYNIIDRIHSCSSPDDSKLGHKESVKTTTKEKGKHKRTTEAVAPKSTLTESMSHHDIRLAKEKGFKILRLVMSFYDAEVDVKEGMILPIKDNCGDVMKTVTSIILRKYTDSLYSLPDGSLEFKLNVAYTTSPNDAYQPGCLEFIIHLYGDRGLSIDSAPGNFHINKIWSSLSSEEFFFGHTRFMAALKWLLRLYDLEGFPQVAMGRLPRPNSLVIRSGSAALSAMDTKYQPPTVIVEQEDTQLQPAQTVHTLVNTRPADDKSLRPSTSKDTFPDTHRVNKVQHPTTSTCSSSQLHPASQEPHESDLAEDQVPSQRSSPPLASLTQLLNTSPDKPFPANWHSAEDNSSKTYYYNDKIDIAMYKDPRTFPHPDNRELTIISTTKGGSWNFKMAKDNNDLPLWSHSAGVFCVYPPTENTEQAMHREAIRTAKGGLVQSMRKLWSQGNGAASSSSQKPKSSSMTTRKVLDKLECAPDAGPSRVPLPADWHSDVDGISRIYFYNDKIDVATFVDPRDIMFPDRRESFFDWWHGKMVWIRYKTVDGRTSWAQSDGICCLEPPWLSTEEVEHGEGQRVLMGGLSTTKCRMINERIGMAQDFW